ncbi:hypothetical protein JOC27_002710 [Sporolactobacillus spathodeae]|uniref:Uncharacterized protein n=1 Tax=Sporolactobacillus spathodeae TaxID=1465502 RepID=A0ABS2QBQ8_9BACL|nr:hypothetical protein [Sporolactobacillus spathodeae]
MLDLVQLSKFGATILDLGAIIPGFGATFSQFGATLKIRSDYS